MQWGLGSCVRHYSQAQWTICTTHPRGPEVLVNREGRLMKTTKKNIPHDSFFNFCLRSKVKDASGKPRTVAAVNATQIVTGTVLKDNEMVKTNSFISNSRYRLLLWLLHYYNKYCIYQAFIMHRLLFSFRILS